MSSEIVRENRQTFCRFRGTLAFRYIFQGVLGLLFYFIPLVSITILYSKIMKSLRQACLAEIEQNALQRNVRQNRIVMKTFVWIVVTFFTCWTALIVYIVLKAALPTLFAEDLCMLYLLFYVFPVLNAVFNPAILFLSSSRFSKALTKSLCCFACQPSLRAQPHNSCFT